MKTLLAALVVFSFSAFASPVKSKTVPFGTKSKAAAFELFNDGFDPKGSPVYLQQGFVTGEMAGIWVKVPADKTLVRVTHFRTLIAASRGTPATRLNIFFRMGVGTSFSPSIPTEIENAASVTPGHYWNDIPAQGSGGEKLPCVKAGQLIGAAIEFTHDGLPSVGRDSDGLSNPLANTLFASGTGWNYSSAFGLEGDWVLRVMAEEVTPAECQ